MDDPIRPSPDTLADCVHCGFCLPACPTYNLWGQEADSPRGRIELMRLGGEGVLPIDGGIADHLDACLGCMACVTACPSGVAYGELIEDGRAMIEQSHQRSIGDRGLRAVLFGTFTNPRRLRGAVWAAWLAQRLGLMALLQRSGLGPRLPPRLGALLGLLPDLRAARLRQRPPVHTPARPPQRLHVGLLSGCVQSVLFGNVNVATARVLAAEGCAVTCSADVCCGALDTHTGRAGPARERAKATMTAFAAMDVDRVVVNAAGCGSAMKEYGRLLRNDPQWADRAAAFSATVVDISELLDGLEPRAPRHRVDSLVAYHDACHLAHAQGIRAQPRALLGAIPGLELVELADGGDCCGSAGVYNVLEPVTAAELGQRKAAAVKATGARVIVSANPGCLLQLRRHLGPDVSLHHPIELLDAAIRGTTLD